ncbi:MAG: KEOPS complex subunit Cgi121 [Thermoplasmata archaeon]
MVPPIPSMESRTLQAAGARRSQPGSPDVRTLVSRLRSASTEAPQLVSLFDARAIGGERHLLSAWAHLGRSRSRGRERLRDRGAEFALYVAGDDQLPRALAKVGVSADTETFVLVAERPRPVSELLASFGLVADPSVYPRLPDPEMLRRLGLEPSEWAHLPSATWEGLVLERVALVDMVGPARSGPGKHV